MAQPTIRGYSIGERIGSGGFASVYLATDESGREVAIKVLHDHTSNPSDLRRFERERATMRALNGHPNIVAIYDAGTADDERHFTVLEYVSGGSVRDRLAQGGALHWATVVEVGVQICAALDVAHRSGVLHRDVKPANILLEDNTAKLSDFGIARLIGQSQVTAAQSIIGTLAYTPPEVFHNRPFDGRGDIYQLGITLYEMLLGRAPFTSAAADNKAMIIRRILDNPAPPLAQFDVPLELSNLLDEVLAKDPADRPQTAESFARRLNEVERSLGRTPTTVGNDTQSIDLETASLQDAVTEAPQEVWPPVEDTGEALTQAAEPVAPAPSSAFTVEPSAPTPEVAPQAPVVDSPPDANITVAEPRPSSDTSLLPKSSRQGMALGTPGPAPSSFDAPSPVRQEPAIVEQKPRSRWPWILLVLGLIGAAIAGVVIAQLTATDTDPVADSDPDPVVVVEDEPEPDIARQFQPLNDDAFLQPDTAHGVIFDVVRNSSGLTMVGGAGDGESSAEQSPVVWTLDSDEADMQRAFENGGRLWGIGVTNTEFLAVGDTAGPGETDGLAVIGGRAATFRETTDPSFTGNSGDALVVSVADPSSDTDGFLVGGRRTSEGTETLGLWSVSRPTAGANPEWTSIPVGSGNEGSINAIAVNDEIGVAVGWEMIDGVEMGVFLIRRDNGDWPNLIRPFPNTRFHGVAIAGDRIIAVGESGTNTRTPVAIVASSDGTGWFHQLPIRAVEGVARDVAEVQGDRVLIVGDSTDPDNAGSRTGAIWELLARDEVSEDQWTTRASTDIPDDVFTELRAISEFEDTIYIFGRTELENGRRPAGAWTLTLDS